MAGRASPGSKPEDRPASEPRAERRERNMANTPVQSESGAVNSRPELARALELCRLTGASLVVAKIDRLSRDAHFLLGLQRADVPITFADMPHADEFTVGILG